MQVNENAPGPSPSRSAIHQEVWQLSFAPSDTPSEISSPRWSNKLQEVCAMDGWISSSIEMDWNSGNHDTTLLTFSYVLRCGRSDSVATKKPIVCASSWPWSTSLINSLSGSKSMTSSWTYPANVFVSWCKHKNNLYVSGNAILKYYVWAESIAQSSFNLLWMEPDGSMKRGHPTWREVLLLFNKPRHMLSTTIPTDKSPNQSRSNSSLWLWRPAVMRGLPTTLATILRTPYYLKSCHEKTVVNPPFQSENNWLCSSVFIVHFTSSCLWVYSENPSWNKYCSKMLILILTPKFCPKSVCFFWLATLATHVIPWP